MPSLTTDEAKAYEKLVKLAISKVTLTNNRNMDWLFILWGSGNKILPPHFQFFLAFSLLILRSFNIVSAICSWLLTGDILQCLPARNSWKGKRRRRQRIWSRRSRLPLRRILRIRASAWRSRRRAVGALYLIGGFGRALGRSFTFQRSTGSQEAAWRRHQDVHAQVGVC